MFVPLAHLRYFDGAEILLNNNGIDPLVVRPMWFVRGSEPVRGREVMMPPLTMDVKQIGALLPDGVPASRVDGLLIEYDGKMMELGGQVVLRHASKQTADTLDVHFSMGMDFHSARREATWTSTPGESAILVLANTAGEPTKVTIASSSGSSTVVVDPYQAQLVRLEVPVPGKGDTGKQAMWAVIDSTGVPADLRVTGFVSTDRGAPRLIRFYDPSAVKQPHLYATRMRVTNASGDLALKNTSALPITARAAFLDGESGQILYELPPVSLGPKVARTIDLGAAMAVLAGSTGAEPVSVRVESTGPVGALIGSLYVHDTKIGTPFDVPLRDSGAARSSTGSYPWRIDGDYETRASITNAGTVTAQFVARIALDGDGELVFGPRELAPGASATFDLRALRDQGIKDAKGRALPPGAERGRFIWTILTSGQSARLVGRAEVTSTKLGVSSSYSCGQCCPDSWLFSTISPYQQSMSVGSSAAYTIVGYWESCYHQQWSMNISPYGWNVNAPGVASLASQYPGGHATGQGEGTTDFAGWWGVERWEPYIEDCVVDAWSWEQPGAAQVVVPYPTNIRLAPNQPQPHAGTTGGPPLPYLTAAYMYDSSHGALSNLSQCEVWEDVTYNPNPPSNPPFPGSLPPMPAKMSNGPAGGFTDNHLSQGPIGAANGTLTGSQRFKYRCTNISNNALQNMSGPNSGPHDIVRTVSGGGSSFTITKHSAAASCSLSSGWCQ